MSYTMTSSSDLLVGKDIDFSYAVGTSALTFLRVAPQLLLLFVTDMNFLALLLVVLISCFLVLESKCTSITSLLQNNVAGPAVNFQTVSWPIDPDAGLRRRKEYEAINGRFGNKAVERVGLGEDGRTEERRIQQRIRDEIGALSYQPPY